MMDMKGRWFTRNKTLVQVHFNPAALPGNRIERWIGHSVPDSRLLKVCWNENGECVWIQGIVDDTSKYDLVERVTGSNKAENGIGVVGCGECDKESMTK